MTKTPLLTAFALAALLAAPARAQAWSDPGVGAGGHLELTKGSAGSAALSGGAQVRARLTGGLGVEGLVAVRREAHEAAGERVLTLTEVPVQISAMLFFLFRTRVQPYLVAGIGYYYVHARGEGSNAAYGSHSENKFGFHGGAGLDVRLAPRVSAHADVRYVSLDVNALTALADSYGVTRRGDFVQATAGATFSF